MSRIGKLPISIPENVQVQINERVVTVKGSRGELNRRVPSCCEVFEENRQLIVKRLRKDKQSKALHGTTRSLIFNMIKGISEGFEKHLQIVGMGYKASMEKGYLIFNLGFSHLVKYRIPQEIMVEVSNPTTICIRGCDKQKVGEVAAEIRALKKPEPYKGKGIRYRGEVVRRKIGKAALGSKGK